MRALLLCLVALSLTTPAASATATATEGQPIDQDPATAPYVQIARDQWPDSPCEGRERVVWERGMSTGRGHAGEADLARCLVFIDPSLPAYFKCAALAHELGHLARQDGWHDDARTEPVFGWHPVLGLVLTVDFPECLATVGRGLSLRQARRASRRALGGRGRCVRVDAAAAWCARRGVRVFVRRAYVGVFVRRF